MIDIQPLYQKAIAFAGAKHGEQTIPGTKLPYVIHISNVAMEILVAARYSPELNAGFAVQVALLHDVLEDTPTTMEELETTFGKEIAEAVAALTKKDSLPKAEKMQDSLSRIQQRPKEVWAVKLADRITNLQAPPLLWNTEKKKEYLQEAETILQKLQGGNAYLEEQLKRKIDAYKNYIV